MIIDAHTARVGARVFELDEETGTVHACNELGERLSFRAQVRPDGTYELSDDDRRSWESEDEELDEAWMRLAVAVVNRELRRRGS
jgi:hypothetical protein